MEVYKYIAIILFNAIEFVLLYEYDDCPKGEIFKSCGTACPPTCTKPFTKICTDNCVPGCFCPDNKLRDEHTGQCVDIASCSCPVGEKYHLCGTACPETCESEKPKFCTRQCVAGCFCEEGTVRQQMTGKCVHRKCCVKCEKDERYTNSCVSAKTCENPHLTICLRRRGCTCKKGLVRDTEIDECVPIEECPQTEPTECKLGETFMECGPGCLATCSDPEPEVCTLSCRRGCFCPEGQVRNDFNDYTCIDRYDCPNLL